MQKFPCPCCLSLVYMQPSTGDYSICPICMWEDDPVQMDDPNYIGGANRLSLNQARREYQTKQRNLQSERLMAIRQLKK